MIKAVIFDMFEPHIPCPPLPNFPHAATQADILKFLDEE